MSSISIHNLKNKWITIDCNELWGGIKPSGSQNSDAEVSIATSHFRG